MKKLFTHLALIFLSILFINPNSLKAENGQMLFEVFLSGVGEVPITNSDGYGLITFLFSEDRQQVFVHGVITNLAGSTKKCEIHFGYYDANGPLIIDLTPFIKGNKIKGTLTTQAAILFENAVNEELYVNVITDAYPTGEIRGQIYWETDYILPVIANSRNEVPPFSSTANGFGTLRFSENLSRMQYDFIPLGLTGAVTGASINYGTAGMNGPLISNLNIGDVISGTLVDDSLVAEIFYQTLNDSAYLNIQTAAKPNGEIRGPLVFDNPNNATAFLNGNQETPPNNSSAKAVGYASLDFPNLDTIRYIVYYSGIVPTAAHIHNGKPGIAGAVVIPMRAAGTGVYSGKSVISNTDLDAFMKDELYFNIHSNAFPNGEIRGQFQNNLLRAYAFDLCGDQEVPKINGGGYGAAYVTTNKANTELNYGFVPVDLTGDATSAHIHTGAFGSNGPIIFDLDASIPVFYDYLQNTIANADEINLDQAYIDVHTDANPDGEIRGQIRRTLSCSINTATIQSIIHDLSLKNNLVKDNLVCGVNSDKNFIINFYVTDNSGKQLLQGQRTQLIKGSNEISLNVEALSQGFYIFTVNDEYHSVRSFKFVKQ